LNVAYPWSEKDSETAIQAAAHMGNVPIAELLLDRGAPLAIPTAAMLGRRADVTHLLDEDPARIAEAGAHGITLLAHAALSGDADLVRLLYERGARPGASHALENAVARGHLDLARWLLENAGPDLGWKNFQGKSLLALAEERSHAQIAGLLRQHGATE
jgi:ankyrin repeat protein